MDSLPPSPRPAAPRPASGPPRRIAVLRALQLGDLLCAVPALRALRRAYPGAEIALIGLPWSAGWVQRMRCVDRWFEFPGWPGLPERMPDLRAIPAFIALMQACRFDLALQLHGAGSIVNPLVASFGADACAGFFRDGEYCPDPLRFAAWPTQGHEIERCLALTDALGLPRDGLHLEFPLQPCDRAAVAQRWPQLAQRPYLVLHAGAQLPSRRWPVTRFAQVATALQVRGLTVVLTGTADERPLAEALLAAMPAAARTGVVDAVGQTTLWQLGALVERADLVVCNDTGISHVAAALRVPSVVVSSGADTARWAPLDRARHRVLAHDVPCRPCGHRSCPTAHECALAVEPAAVVAAAHAQLDAFALRAAPAATSTMHDRHATPA
jgi:ADP-heptose:LPS heptosyltransferase